MKSNICELFVNTDIIIPENNWLKSELIKLPVSSHNDSTDSISDAALYAMNNINKSSISLKWKKANDYAKENLSMFQDSYQTKLEKAFQENVRQRDEHILKIIKERFDCEDFEEIKKHFSINIESGFTYFLWDNVPFFKIYPTKTETSEDFKVTITTKYEEIL